MKMSHEEYVQKKRDRVGVVAQGMLDGSMHYLEGSIELSSLMNEVDVPEDDEDFRAFVGVSSEIDHLPIGASRQHWSEEALARHESEIQESIEWAKEFSLSQCKSLAERFSA
jgi:hypothetical protein